MEIIENKAPQVLLSGRLQVSIAHEAVDASGVNPELAQKLGDMLLTHEKLSDGIAQDDLKVHARLNTIQSTKQDILAGLEHVKNGRYHREKRIDASLLLDVLYEEWGSKSVEEIDFYKYTMEKADNDLGVAVCTLEKGRRQD